MTFLRLLISRMGHFETKISARMPGRIFRVFLFITELEPDRETKVKPAQHWNSSVFPYLYWDLKHHKQSHSELIRLMIMALKLDIFTYSFMRPQALLSTYSLQSIKRSSDMHWWRKWSQFLTSWSLEFMSQTINHQQTSYVIICVHVFIYVHTGMCVYMCVFAYMYRCTYVCVHVCVCVCVVINATKETSWCGQRT